MKNYKFGVVIACLNEEALIGRTIESIQNLIIKPEIIIVVDDGSLDNTVLIASQYEKVEIIQLENRGYNAVGKPELALTFNIGFKRLESFDLDYILVAGSDNIYSKFYVDFLVEEFRKPPFLLALVSGFPAGSPIKKTHVSGGGRLISTKFFKEIGFQFPVIHGWETSMIFSALKLEYRAYSIDLAFISSRKPGTNFRSYVDWGKGMKALGYWWPFAFKWSLSWIFQRRISNGFQLMKGYYSRDIVYADKELRQFIKKYQQKKAFRKVWRF